MSDDPRQTEPAEKLLQLLGGKWVAAAVSAAASLGVADALTERSLPLGELADRISCQEASLARLMRVLVGEEIVSLNAQQEYELTPTGSLLRSSELGELAKYVGAPFGWDAWSSLADSVRTGEAAFTKRHGLPLFDYLDHHGEEAALYHAAIDAHTRREATALADAFDFSQATRIADIGGGQGRLLVEVLTRWEHLTGVLLERPGAVERAQLAFEQAGISERCEAKAGDFFREVPQDIDVCVLMHILHSWDDVTAIDLLRRCRDAVGPQGTVLVVEGVLVPDGRRDLTNLLDLEMLVLCGPGHERRKPEMRRLISAADLRIEQNITLTPGIRMLAAKPRSV